MTKIRAGKLRGEGGILLTFQQGAAVSLRAWSSMEQEAGPSFSVNLRLRRRRFWFRNHEAWGRTERTLTNRRSVNRKPCSGRDLNPHAFRHTPLKRTCLPFHHPSVVWKIEDGRWEMRSRKRFVRRFPAEHDHE